MIDLKTVILNSDGEAMKQNFKTAEIGKDGKEKISTVYREIVLKDIIKCSLLNKSQDDMDAEERGKNNEKLIKARFQLWKKIQPADEIDLTSKEKKLLKKLIRQHYEILVAGQVLEILS